MDTRVAKEMIGVIRAERDRRFAQLKNVDPDFVRDQWLFTDEPFINELCLTMLVAVHHQVERELVRLSARATGDGREMDREQYQLRVTKEREQLRARGGRKKMMDKLNLSSFAEWDSMEALRFLANCFKHSPSSTPEADLLKHLRLDPVPQVPLVVGYASLPESHFFQDGLTNFLNLPTDADYCDIAEELMARADRFMAAVQGQSGLSTVNWGPVSLARFVG